MSQGDAAVYWGQDKDFNPIGNGASMRRTVLVKAMLDKIGTVSGYRLDKRCCEIKDAYIEYIGFPISFKQETSGEFRYSA